MYADGGQTAPIDAVAGGDAPSPIRLLDAQARAMLLEAADGQGLVTITVATGNAQGPPPIAQITAIAKTAAAHLGS